jgi:hypothetical protein
MYTINKGKMIIINSYDFVYSFIGRNFIVCVMIRAVIRVSCKDIFSSTWKPQLVAAGENENDLNHCGLYSNKTVMVIITIKLM